MKALSKINYGLVFTLFSLALVVLLTYSLFFSPWQELKLPSEATTVPITHIIVLGDSISAGGGEGHYSVIAQRYLEKKQGNTITLINKAAGGTGTASLVEEFTSAVTQLKKPATGKVLILFTSGGNDYTAAFRINPVVPASKFAEITKNINELVQQAKKQAVFFPQGYTLYQMDLYDPTDGTGNPGKCSKAVPPFQQPIATFNQIRQAYVNAENASSGKLHTVHVYPYFLGHGYYYDNKNNPYYHPTDPTSWLTDCLHPNLTGGRLIGNEFINTINRYEFNILPTVSSPVTTIPVTSVPITSIPVTTIPPTTIVIQAKPTVNTLRAREISDEQAIISASVDDATEEIIKRYGLVISAVNHVPTKNDFTLSSTGFNSYYEIQYSSLIPNTTYYVRAFADTATETIFGNVISFKTLPPITPTVTRTSSPTITVSTSPKITQTGTVSPTPTTNTQPILLVTHSPVAQELTITRSPTPSENNTDATISPSSTSAVKQGQQAKSTDIAITVAYLSAMIVTVIGGIGLFTKVRKNKIG